MAIRKARDQIGRIFSQRCFYLFLLLLALIGVVPFIEPTPTGQSWTNRAGVAKHQVAALRLSTPHPNPLPAKRGEGA